MTNIQQLRNSVTSLEKKVTVINDKLKKKDHNSSLKNSINLEKKINEKKINLNELQLEIASLKRKQKNLNLLFTIIILLFISYILLTIKLWRKLGSLKLGVLWLQKVQPGLILKIYKTGLVNSMNLLIKI